MNDPAGLEWLRIEDSIDFGINIGTSGGLVITIPQNGLNYLLFEGFRIVFQAELRLVVL